MSTENTRSFILCVYVTRNFVICTPEQKSLGWSNTEERVWLVMWNVWGSGEVHTGFWVGVLREGYHLGYINIDGRMILKWIIIMWDGEAWTGILWQRIGTVAGRCEYDSEPLISIKCRTSWLAEDLFVSQVGLCFKQFSYYSVCKSTGELQKRWLQQNIVRYDQYYGTVLAWTGLNLHFCL